MSPLMIIAVVVFFCLAICGVKPLQNVQVIVPSVVSINQSVMLTCLYDLDYNESLYTVKWYLDDEEFYRYVPKEVPPIKIFPLAGINIDTLKSDAHRMYLKNVSHGQTGRYRCEVSADAPYFDTDIASSILTVVEFPENLPLIQVQKQKYEVGERIRAANCSFGPSKPSANITWFINNVQVKDQFVSDYPVFEDGSGYLWVKSALNIDSHINYFRGSRLKLKCVASIYSIYHKTAQIQLEEEKPRSASVLGSQDLPEISSNSATNKKTGVSMSSSYSLHYYVQFTHNLVLLIFFLIF